MQNEAGSLSQGSGYRSDLALQIGVKGYHSERFEKGPYPVGGF